MAKKILLSLLFIGVTFNSFSQKKRVLVKGKIVDSLGIVKNANIVNIKTLKGTFSNDNGEFRIYAQAGDSLKISSVQHITETFVINKYNIDNNILIIKLRSNIYQLDEFELKRHNLSGILGIDSKNVPINKKDSLLNSLMDFSKVDMGIVEDNDYIDERVRPNVVRTDPNSNFKGVGTSISMPFGHSKKLWALRKKLAQQKSFPKKILSELGEKFFFEKLKIPKESFFHFLEYCNPLGIEDLHKRGKILEIIEILTKESSGYLKIIKKE